MLSLGERTKNILSGMVASVLSLALVTFGVKVAFGALEPTYELSGLFSSAGQGLLPGSDVKIRGVNVGEVDGIELHQGRALVTLAMDEGERIPVDATATIRPKTLFGEKFVDIDPGPHEVTGPYLAAGGTIERTVGSVEVQKVLDEAYPILDAIDPVELATVLGVLADGGRDLGDEINRSFRNFAAVSDVNVRHDADTRQFLGDLARLSDVLADAAPDLVAGAADLNHVLPDLNARGDQLAVLLDQASRLSADVADVLESNRSFLEKNVTQGGKTLQVLDDHRSQVQPLVGGLRMFFQTLAQAIRIPLADGTRLAAVKFVAGGGNPFGQGQGAPTASTGGAATDVVGPAGPAGDPLAPPAPEGADAITRLLREVLG